jgi:hypothetical protein
MVRPNGADIILLWSATRNRTRDLAEEYQLRLPVVADEDLHLRQEFKVMHVPMSMLVDEQGRVVAKGFAQNLEQLEALLAPPEVGEPELTDDDAAPSAAPLAVGR